MKTTDKNIAIKSQDLDQAEKLNKIFFRANANCSIKNKNSKLEGYDSVILILSDNDDFSKEEKDLTEINNAIENNHIKHGFIWNPSKGGFSERQSSLVGQFLSRNLTFSRERFSIRFVEDVLKTISIRAEESRKSATTDISLFYNVLDEDVAEMTGTMLEDIFSINKIAVDLSDPKSSIESFYQSAIDSSFIVVLFNQEHEWAELFTQEIWKKIGGASANIPILLIGSEEHPQSTLSIPKVYYTHANEGLMALEIKVQFDTIKNQE